MKTPRIKGGVSRFHFHASAAKLKMTNLHMFSYPYSNLLVDSVQEEDGKSQSYEVSDGRFGVHSATKCLQSVSPCGPHYLRSPAYLCGANIAVRLYSSLHGHLLCSQKDIDLAGEVA